MHRPVVLQLAVRALLAAAIAANAACSVLGPAPDSALSRLPPVPRPPAERAPEPAPAAPPADTGAAPGSAEPPVTAEAAAPRPEPAPLPRVLVVASSDAAGYRDVAVALDAVLAGRYAIERITLSEASAGAAAGEAEARAAARAEAGGQGAATGSAAAGDDALAGVDTNDLTAVVAIGIEAAERAGRSLRVPTIFCQVFGYRPLLSLPTAVYGVAALPPLDLSLERWKRLAPEAASLGVIANREDPRLVDEARRAARAAGLELYPQLAASDREALYRFKRLVPRIDGLLLLPDNEILSPPAIREMLDYALKHGVHTLVFNATLLEWGALMSAGSRAEDVAARVADVLGAVTNGSGHELPAITPLDEVEIRINEEVASGLGLAPPAAALEVSAL